MAKPLAAVLEETERKPGDVFGEQVRRHRDRRGWTQRDLCRKIEEKVGATIDPATLARLEKGQRRVSLDEACMLAVVLGVPLLALMWPLKESEPMSVAPGVAVPPWRAMEWAVGNDPLPGVETEPEHWNYAFRLIGLVIDLLNVAELADLDRIRSPAEKYRERLQEVAKYLYEADEIGLATEGMISEPVLEDLEREIGRAPTRKQRYIRQQREES